MISPEKLFLFIFLLLFLHRSIVGWNKRVAEENSEEEVITPPVKEMNPPQPVKRRPVVYNEFGLGVRV